MANFLFVLWMGLSATLLLLFVCAAFLNLRNRRTRRVRRVELDELIPSFLRVNVETLAELIDPAQEERLRQGCLPKELAELQRQRVQLTIECLRRMSHNAALLQQLGYSQLQSPNQLISSLAQEMIDAGVHVRLYTFVGLIGLQLRNRLRIAPLRLLSSRRIGDVHGLLSASLIPAYEQLKDKAGNLTCLKYSSLREDLVQSL
jgi:hypothetical protein